jgi:hypothetical protein
MANLNIVYSGIVGSIQAYLLPQIYASLSLLSFYPIRLEIQDFCAAFTKSNDHRQHCSLQSPYIVCSANFNFLENHYLPPILTPIRSDQDFNSSLRI